MPDFWLVRSDSIGDTLWTRTFGNEMGIETAYSVQLTPDGGYILAGEKLPEGAIHADMYVVKTGEDHTGNVRTESTYGVPKNYMLLPSYPNPFNATTRINYEIPINTKISIDIYNVLGQKVAMLFNGMQQPGRYELTWSIIDAPSGIYFCRMEAGNFQQTQKLVILK